MEYNYVAQEDDELTLRKGDIITGIKVMLGGWWEGTLRDKRGMFPDNFVKVIKHKKSVRFFFHSSCVCVFLYFYVHSYMLCSYTKYVLHSAGVGFFDNR